ncbi:hypothetical protein TNCV_4530851 [Trichonephila clavipes]|nr:hypothetical protein TNCV_4530851 [Trichonephila clavipes]
MMLGLTKVVFSILLSGMMVIGRVMESGRRGYGSSSGWKVLEFFDLAESLEVALCLDAERSPQNVLAAHRPIAIDLIPTPVLRTSTAGSDVVQSGRPIFDDFFHHLWPYIGNSSANIVFQMVKRLWLIRLDQWLYIAPQKIV